MHFPKKTGDKRKRKAIRKGAFREDTIKQDSYFELRRNFRSGLLVGEILRLQCSLAFYWGNVPSVRFLSYALQSGFLNEWAKHGYPTKNLRSKYAQFKNVSHLWATINYMSIIDEKNRVTHPIDYATIFTGEFLGFAQIFRNIALNAKLINRKTDLWMPNKWRDLAIVPRIDAVVSRGLEKDKKWLESLWEDYLEKEYWKGN
jgi:hypothetical protein